jgi:NAD(P)-dependent dehydrogenase (short-subunit alcohol dehydrogenase family)
MTKQSHVVLVTGASSGIGRATARQLATRGSTVFGLASTSQSAETARTADPDIHWLAGDLRDPATPPRVIREVVSSAGRLDALVNNAGIYKFAPAAATSDELLREHFDINVLAPFALIRAALPALAESRGAIVNVSSTSAWKPMPNVSAYGASKAALESLTRSLAVELAPQGIRVNAVSPGPTVTEGITRLPYPPEVKAQMKAQLEQMVPLRRAANPDEIAHWIVALADPTVTWVTGQILGVDGGLGAT